MSSVPPAKRCTKCGETKPLDEFYAKPTGKLGRASACKACAGTKAREYQAANPEREKARRAARYARERGQAIADARTWAIANAERARATKAAWYAENREASIVRNKANREANLERYEAQRAKYRAANRQREIQRAQEWYAANPDRARDRRRQYKRKNPAIFVEANRRRRARKSGAVLGILDAAQWAAILDYFGHACAYCNATGVKLTQDHVVPLARGGEHTASNVIPACGLCNRRKWLNPLWRFLLDESQRHE